MFTVCKQHWCTQKNLKKWDPNWWFVDKCTVLECSCCLTGTRYTASTGIVVFNGIHSTSPCTKLMKFETSKFLKKIKGPGSWRLSHFWRFIKVFLLTHWSMLHCQHWYRCVHDDPLYKSMDQTHEVWNVQTFEKNQRSGGHGDWAIFEGLLKCSCWLTGACYTASTGIVVFTTTHSTSPWTKLMKCETSKLLKKIKGPGSWRLSHFWRFIKVFLLTHWNTVHRQHWYRCVQWDPLYKSMHQTHEVWNVQTFEKNQRSGVMAIEPFLKVY